MSLDKVREYEKSHKSDVANERPIFHFTPLVGWMNDPNGFSPYKGEYHLFYQYYPFDTIWGAMHWGHTKTKDFIRWEHLPAALAPDMPYDQNGCFSGGAIELEDGRQLIMYSGVTPLNYNIDEPVEDLPPESDRYQNQCIAIGDGINYEKSGTNPMLVASTVPEGGSLVDFRDPKLWKEDDGYYYTVIANRPASGNGDILLYKSADALHWDFVSVLISNDGTYGRMWECPDLFTLDGRDVMLVSPMEMKEQGLEYHNGHITMALIGQYDREDHKFKNYVHHAIDYGVNFYSTQSLETYDGRRIMIAWMMNWVEQDVRMDGLHFFGQNTIPRELHIVGDRMIQNPVRELENYRVDKVAYENVMLGSENSEDNREDSHNDKSASCEKGSYITLDGIKGRILDMTIELTPTEAGSYKEWNMQVAVDENHHLLVQYLPEENIIIVDRHSCGENQKEVWLGKFYVRDRQGALKLRVLMDKYSIELFANDGEQAATYTFYTDLSADGIQFGADGEVKMDIEKYRIEV